MWRLITACSFVILSSSQTFAQLQKFYSVKPGDDYEKVVFTLNATSGSCYIKPSSNDNPIDIYGNPDFEEINPSFKSYTNRHGINFVDLNLEDYQQGGLTKTISFNMFEDRKADTNFWKIYFNQDKIYDLNLNYGIGNANLNLSGVPIDHFNVSTGSADVVINYEKDGMNPIAMDTFAVKVDLGSFEGYNLTNAHASYIFAHVGFGNALLDFSKQSSQKCNIEATVAAGRLVVYIPKEHSPTIIYLNQSPLCSTRLTKDFRELEDNVFVNTAYTPDAENLTTFTIDVGMGNVIFRNKD